MIKKSKTFCVAPWFQIRNQNNMNKKVCCLIKPLPGEIDSKSLTPLEYLNSKTVINLKKQLAEGKKPRECGACWKNEKHGNKSLREQLNGILTSGNPEKNNWIDFYFKNKKDYNSDMILMADIKIGNTCNHACVMCNPNDSSLIYNDWMKRKDSIFVKDYLSKDRDYLKKSKFNGYKNKKYKEYIDAILKDNKKLKYLKLLGGEPFLDNDLIKSLENMDNKVKENLKISFVTNGSVDIISVVERIGKFKHIDITVSVEGVGKIQEFARAGSVWKNLEKNILKTIDRNICDLTVHHSLQTCTVLGFDLLLDWCRSNSIKLSCGLVSDPDYLSIRSLPTTLKNKLINNIQQNKTRFINQNNAETGATSYDNLISSIKDFDYDPVLNKKFFEYIEWYQSNKNIPKLQSIFPELYNQ